MPMAIDRSGNAPLPWRKPGRPLLLRLSDKCHAWNKNILHPKLLPHAPEPRPYRTRLVSSDVSMPRSCPGQIAERVSPLRPP